MLILLFLLRIKLVFGLINWPKFQRGFEKRTHQRGVRLSRKSVLCMQSAILSQTKAFRSIGRSCRKTMQVHKFSYFAVAVSNLCHVWRTRLWLRTRQVESWESWEWVAGVGLEVITLVQIPKSRCFLDKMKKSSIRLRGAIARKAFSSHAVDAVTAQTLNTWFSIT